MITIEINFVRNSDSMYMKIISKKTACVFSLISILLVFGFSCQKSDGSLTDFELTGGDITSHPLIVKARLNFVDDEDSMDFTCYQMKDYGEILIAGDSSMSLRFRSIDKNGIHTNGPTILVIIRNKKKDGFHSGDVYSILDNPNKRTTLISLTKNDNTLTAYTADNFVGPHGMGSLEIISLQGNYLKCKFSYTLKTENSIKEATLTKGIFEGDIVFN